MESSKCILLLKCWWTGIQPLNACSFNFPSNQKQALLKWLFGIIVNIWSGKGEWLTHLLDTRDTSPFCLLMPNLLNEWGLIIASISYQLWFLSPPQWDCLLKWLQKTPSFAPQQHFFGPQFSWWFGTLNTFDYFLYHNTAPPALSLYFYFFSVSYSYSCYFLPFVEDLRIW